MNFQQLRIIRAAVQCDFNLTQVAESLYTSQSGVSKHIRDLEEELGVELFVRRGKRLLGLTSPGRDLLPVVERMLLDASNIKRLGEHYAQRDAGELIVATTHTQARYALPQAVAQFKAAFPRVHLLLHQGSPNEIVSMLMAGEADIGIATEALATEPEIASFTFYEWRHACVVLKGHALTRAAPLTLAAIARHPIITYHHGFTGRGRIDDAFRDAGLRPDVVLSALDTDVIKTYVELGLGVGLIAPIGFLPERDPALELLPTADLFPPSVTRIGVRKGRRLRDFASRFISLCAPQLGDAELRAAFE
jgi:LysR family cys regulon transcriptional activator